MLQKLDIPVSQVDKTGTRGRSLKTKLKKTAKKFDEGCKPFEIELLLLDLEVTSALDEE